MKLINDEIRIEVTNLCNATCVICPREKLTRELTTMDNCHYEYLIDQAVDLGAKTASLFGFGESLLDPSIVYKVWYAKQKGLKTFITTNASLLTVDKAFDLLENGLDHIRFSCHGTFDSYEKVHRKLNWMDVQRNIFNFLKINDVRNGGRCKTEVVVIPMHEEHPEYFVKFWGGKVDDIQVWKPHGWGGMRKYRKETEEKLTSCGRPFTGPVQVQADGTVIPCCFLTNSEIVLGDTHKNTIEEILKSDAFNELRDRHRVGDLDDLPCGSCDQLYVSDEPFLLYSSDKEMAEGKTSSTKFEIETF